MQLFFNPNITETTQDIAFDKIESKHIVRVLRKKEESLLHITNGKGFLFTAKIIIASDKKCVATIVEVVEKPKHWNYYLHIAVAPTKNNDRLEWFLEKATEIGIDEITPIICSNSERKVVKIERLQKIIQAAMKQSLQTILPKLNEPVKFNEFVTTQKEGALFIAHCEDDIKKILLKNVAVNSNQNTILIGPEGDFSKKEIELALQKNYTPISLGESRLRTETAALAAVHTLSLINQ